ncbi:uncharacterized protein LOC142557385 [Dermacentor variabilis]|uniref:uncharacterized protein LOC142557385 n=1 Tax=Dermacentor variabilis TaxID=34621 RepID=UPI003F5C0301
MPDQRRPKLYRVRGHAVGGVNWRPTRFAEDVPQAHVCCLCGTIPARTVLLPCAHLLCEPCHGRSSNRGNGLCPLDREPFEEHDCSVIVMPVRKASNLRAHCWNEAAGCEFVGALEAVLRHYEHECDFHAVECPRCGETVLHKELPTHYMSACIAETLSASDGDQRCQDGALTTEDLDAAARELKTLLSDPHRDRVPALQSQVNALVEHGKNQGAQLMEIARSIAEFQRRFTEEMARLVGRVSSSSSFREGLISDTLECGSSKQEKLAFQDRAVPPEGGVTQESITWSLEQKLILRKLELLSQATVSSIDVMRQEMRADRRTTAVFCKPVGPSFCHVVNKTLSSSLNRGTEWERRTYLLTVRSASELFDHPGPCRKFAAVTQCHDRDNYFIFYLSAGRREGTEQLILSLECGGFLDTSCLLSAAFDVWVIHDEEAKDRPMQKLRSGFPFAGIHFKTKLLALKAEGFLRNDELKFRVVISR